ANRAAVEGGYIESVGLTFHFEIHVLDARSENIMAGHEAAADGIGTGATGSERVRGLAVGLPDSRMAGAAGNRACHQGYQRDHHSMRSFSPICRAPCLSGLYCGISEVK